MIRGRLSQTKNMTLINMDFSRNILSKYSHTGNLQVTNSMVFADTHLVNNCSINNSYSSVYFYMTAASSFQNLNSYLYVFKNIGLMLNKDMEGFKAALVKNYYTWSKGLKQSVYYKDSDQYMDRIAAISGKKTNINQQNLEFSNIIHVYKDMLESYSKFKFNLESGKEKLKALNNMDRRNMLAQSYKPVSFISAAVIKDNYRDMVLGLTVDNKRILIPDNIRKTGARIGEKTFSNIASAVTLLSTEQSLKNAENMDFNKKVLSENILISVRDESIATNKFLYNTRLYSCKNEEVKEYLSGIHAKRNYSSGKMNRIFGEYSLTVQKSSFNTDRIYGNRINKYVSPPDMEFVKQGSSLKTTHEKSDETKISGCINVKQNTGPEVIDIKRLADKVYTEIENKIKRERERRGM